jgi:DNA-binding transcriptional MerR regulator
MNNYYFASDVQKKFELNNDTFSLYIDLCKHFRDEEKFYKYDLPFFIQKNKIKTKYNFFDKFFTIKKIVKKHPFHKTIHNAAQCSTQEIISFFKNYSYKEFSKFRVFSQSDEFAQTLKFSKNEDYNFDLQKYKKYIKYTQFDEKNIHMLSFNLEKAKQQIKELLIQKTQKESKIIEEAFFAALHQKILNNRELNKEFNDLYKHAQGLRMREVK